MFESVMWNYIREEPEVLENLLATNDIQTNINRFASSEALYLVAHGSSYNAATAIAPLISKLASIRVYAGTPSYFRYNMHAKDLEEKAGISHYTINKLNRGENVTTDVLVRICDALDCTMDDILEIQRPQPVLRETRMDDP